MEEPRADQFVLHHPNSPILIGPVFMGICSLQTAWLIGKQP